MQYQERKKKMLLVLPVIVVPFLCLLFYSLKAETTPGADAGNKEEGLNTNVPSAALPGNDPTDKLSLYQQAERDSLKREEQLRNDGFFTMPARDGMDAPTGAVAAPFDPAAQAGYHQAPLPAEIKVQRKLSALQQELERLDTAATPLGSAPQDIAGAADVSQQMQQIEAMIQSMSAGSPAQLDPEMAQLNDMLDKIMRIQDPAGYKASLQRASAGDKKKAFPVFLQDHAGIVDYMETPGIASGSPITGTADSTSKPVRRLPRRQRFYDLENTGTSYSPGVGIPAVVHGTQAIVAGTTVKLRLEQDVYISGQHIPVGSFVYGKCGLSGDRLTLPIIEIQYRNAIYPVELTVYGLDGMEGIPVRETITGEVTKENASDALQSLQLAAMDPSITQQAASAGIETVRGILRKKTKLVRMTLKAEHPVLLMNKSEL